MSDQRRCPTCSWRGSKWEAASIHGVAACPRCRVFTGLTAIPSPTPLGEVFGMKILADPTLAPNTTRAVIGDHVLIIRLIGALRDIVTQCRHPVPTRAEANARALLAEVDGREST